MASLFFSRFRGAKERYPEVINNAFIDDSLNQQSSSLLIAIFYFYVSAFWICILIFIWSFFFFFFFFSASIIDLKKGAFESENVTHVEGDVDPIRDIKIINDELRLKDLEYLNSNIEKLERTVLRGDKKNKAEYVSLLSLIYLFWTLDHHFYTLTFFLFRMYLSKFASC